MESTKMINKKVPGAVPPIGKLEDEANKFKKEIIKKKTCELKDLLNRQNAILQNPKLIATLADKGEKVRLRQQMLQGIIESRESCSVDNASNLLEKMGINDASKPIDINKMEWQLGGANLMNQYNNLKKLDSDDESDYEGDTENIENDVEFQKNPLKLLASRSEVSSYKIKKTYATSLAERGDTGTKNSKSDIDTRFAPFNSLRHETLSEENKLDIEKTLIRTNKLNKKPKELMPLPSNKYSCLKAKTIHLDESIALQKQQAEKLKEIQFKQAADRLACRVSNGEGSDISFLSESKRMAYRDPCINGKAFGHSTIDNVSEYLKEEEADDDSETEDCVRVNFTQEELDLPN